jgi:beta-galactosidase
MRTIRFESFAPQVRLDVHVGNTVHAAGRWLETVETRALVRAAFASGAPAWINQGAAHYLTTWPEEGFLIEVLEAIAAEAGLTIRHTGPDIRLRQAKGLQFAFNYGPDEVDLTSVGAPPEPGIYRLGGPRLGLGGVAAWPI